MADISASDVLLSAEFTDVLTDNMLIVPDVQFVFARWAYACLAKQQVTDLDSYNLAKLQIQEGRIPDVGVRANTDWSMQRGMGGPLALPGQPFAFDEMFYYIKDANMTPGSTYKVNRPRYSDGLTTLANRRLTAQQKLFSNTQPVGLDQVDVTIYEYAGPGDTVTGSPTPYSIGLFEQVRSKHDLLDIVGNQLRRDRYKFLDDTIIGYLLAAAESNASGITRGGDVSSNAAFVGGGNEPMSLDLLPKMSEQLQSRNVPGIGFDSRWVLVLHPHQMQQLRNDTRYSAASVFMPGYNILFPGYAGTIENFNIVVSQRMPTVSNLGATANQVGYKGLAIGPMALAWACAKDAWCARDKNDDGGRFARFSWISFEGWAAADATFAQECLTT